MHHLVWIEELLADGNAASADTRFARLEAQADQLGKGVKRRARSAHIESLAPVQSHGEEHR
jgi:hypothetical protein